ncbi:two pore domain potassium channel family protein [Gracilibacillus oryzae]|uniref:Two pore domain potassium channel family protein n=1 Tax=Gracilibacillus oryzae TaxID=1672701 RepID=A0A7C8GS55_9BACI|nr:potassium channel family protein [Gracilibacillus oryzae]KAB8127935.1 two pore domain potassium channel family protein [Gracilibacillus oryzae]
MANVLIIIAVVFIIINLYYFFTDKNYRKSYLSTILLRKLFFVVFGLTFGFALIYYALSFNETVVVQSLSSMTPIEPTFGNLLYFSGETILSVGYGDMVPVNSARFFSLLQASLGVLLPTAYFLKALDKSSDKEDS